MLPSQSFSSQLQIKSPKIAFLSLVDAMLYLQRMRELERKKWEANEQAEKKLVALETFKVDLSENMKKLEGVLGEQHAAELSKQVTSFAAAAVDQMKQKLNQESQKQFSMLASDIGSERTKTVKGLEAFLSVSPLLIMDHTVEINLKDSAYSSIARYRCQDNIEYEFSLDTKMSPFFRMQSVLGNIDKTLRIPVALGKSWLKKEPVPDFRSLEHYTVTSAEATESNLIVECSDQGDGDEVKLVYAKRGDHSSLSVSFSQAGNSIEITAEPGLNAYLDSDSFVRFMERLWLALNDLERRKLALTKIVCDDVSVLDNLDMDTFFTKSWKQVSEPVKEMIGRADQKGSTDDETLNGTTVSEKLKVLGLEGAEIAELLGVKTASA